MRARVRRVAATAGAALLLALPVQAQDGGGSVTFNGVGFSFDATLGSSVAIIQVPANPRATDFPGGDPAAHVSFSLSHVTAERGTIPGPWRSDGVVSAYRAADLEDTEQGSEQLEQLRTLLAERPDPAGFMVVRPNLDDEYLPYLPPAEAGQLLRARVEYIDTPQVSGVAYVTAFSQDVTRLAAGDFWYTFQGLSVDGTWYVAVSWVLTVDGFPAQIRGGPPPRNYARYLNQTIARLNGAGPSAISPSLASLDALARSFTFEGVPAREPSPLPSPVPSPAA
jgi:hypothetical protein